MAIRPLVVAVAADVLADLRDPADPPALDRGPRPGRWSEARIATACAARRAQRPGLLCAAALCWHDHWQASHALVQAEEGDREADLLHAVLHRREPDADNACYWLRQVGADHPAYPRLAEAAVARGLTGLAPAGRWSGEAFVTACTAAGTSAGTGAGLIALQALELDLLLLALARG